MNSIKSSAIYSAIPSDWKISPLGELLQRIKNPVEVEADRLYQEIGIYSHGKGIFHKEERTGTSLGNKSVFWIEPDCFVVNIVFAWEQAITKTTDFEKGMIASHRFPMYKPKAGVLDLDFLISFFNTPQGKYLLGLASPGGAGRNKTLGQQAFLDLSIPLPPFTEQRKITDILSTVDQAIALTERRIEAAQRRKKGLVQRLLTGCVRFPEFEEEWKKSEFSDLFETRSSRNHQVKKSEYTDIGKYPIVDQGQQLIAGYTDCNNPIKGVPVIVFGDHTRVLKWVDFPFVVGADGTQLLSTREPCELLFGYYLLHTAHIPNLGYSRHFKLLKEVVFNIPTNKEEQRKIAAILQTCDREIDLLTKKLAALQRQKKGLMQRLLTGRVRVNV